LSGTCAQAKTAYQSTRALTALLPLPLHTQHMQP
jgi:hypothetical protein